MHTIYHDLALPRKRRPAKANTKQTQPLFAHVLNTKQYSTIIYTVENHQLCCFQGFHSLTMTDSRKRVDVNSS